MAPADIEANQPQEVPAELQAELDTLQKETEQVDLDMMIKSMKAHAPLDVKRGDIFRKIPNFWAQTVLNSPLSSFFDPEDAEVFKYLQDLNVEYPQLEAGDPRPVKISFTFGENPFFSNTLLVKEFTLKPDAPAPAPEFDLSEIAATTATPIDWKDDEHNLVKKNPQTKGQDDDDFEPGSFFSHFFDCTNLEVAGPVATAIVADLWQNAPGIYTGTHEGIDLGNLDFDDSDEDDEDDEEDEEDEDPNAEIDLENEPPKKKSKKE